MINYTVKWAKHTYNQTPVPAFTLLPNLRKSFSGVCATVKKSDFKQG